jgi:hypothetical protein
LIGCGSSGGSSSNGITNNNNNGNPSVYTVSFYDSVLDFNGSKEIDSNSPTIDLTQLIDELDVNATALYRASDSNDVLNLGSYTINGNTNFYAVPNVVEITNQEELNSIRDNLRGKYILLNDIELQAIAGEDQDEFNQTYGWKPIGGYNDSDAFSGIFNGNNYKLTGLWIDRTNAYAEGYNVGLFSYVKGDYDEFSNEPAIFAHIRNLGVEIAEGKAVRGDGVVGAIAGYVYNGFIINSYATGEVNGTSSGVGGIAGSIGFYSIITKSYFIGSVSAIGGGAGGLAGSIGFYSIIINSYSMGSVSGNNSNLGGIAGGVGGNSAITDSYSTSEISAMAEDPFSGSYVGGIAGAVRQDSIITRSYSTGNVGSAINEVYPDSVGEYVGGIAGMLDRRSSVTQSYSTGNVSGARFVGGIAGTVVWESNVTTSYATGNITGSSFIGGIAGGVTSTTNGDNKNNNVINNYFTGSTSGGSDVGGIAGNARFGAIIANNYSTGSVNSGVRAGGIVGWAVNNPTIQNNAAINSSIASGDYGVNRVVGATMYGDSITMISNNLARNGLDTTDFFDFIDGNAYSGTGIADDAFLLQDTYQSGLGWSFDGNNDSAPWRIDEGVGYPYFYWQNQ